MNILILSVDNPFTAMGGLGTYLCNKLLYFEKNYKKRIFIDVICPNDNNEGDTYKCHPVYIHRNMSIINKFDPIVINILTQADIISTVFSNKLHTKKYNVIHIQDWYTGLSGLCLSRLFRCPIIFGLHLSILTETPSLCQLYSHKFAKAMEVLLYIRSQLTVCCSKFYYNKIAHLTNNCVIIPNCINVDKWTEVAPYNYNNDKINIVFVGRLVIDKGIVQLIDCILPDNCVLHVIGGIRGGEQPVIEYVASKCDGQQKILYTNVYGDKKIAMLKGADLQIIPSTHEPFGIVALEGLYSKNFIISTCNGGLEEILTDDILLGIKCDPTTTSIEQSINSYLENIHNQSTKDIIAKGVSRVKDVYTPRNVYEQYFKIYSTFI